MTPEAIQILSKLRHQFYSLFEKEMAVPVKVTNRNSYASNLSVASWIDCQQQLNYMCIFAYTAPDELVPDRPLTIQLAVNRGGDVAAIARQKKGNQVLNQRCHFDLVLLPEEILDFLPWIISLIQSWDSHIVASIPAPPHPLEIQPTTVRSFRNAKTQKASSQLAQQTPIHPSQYLSSSKLAKAKRLNASNHFYNAG